MRVRGSFHNFLLFDVAEPMALEVLRRLLGPHAGEVRPVFLHDTPQLRPVRTTADRRTE